MSANYSKWPPSTPKNCIKNTSPKTVSIRFHMQTLCCSISALYKSFLCAKKDSCYKLGTPSNAWQSFSKGSNPLSRRLKSAFSAIVTKMVTSQALFVPYATNWTKWNTKSSSQMSAFAVEAASNKTSKSSMPSLSSRKRNMRQFAPVVTMWFRKNNCTTIWQKSSTFSLRNSDSLKE